MLRICKFNLVLFVIFLLQNCLFAQSANVKTPKNLFWKTEETPLFCLTTKEFDFEAFFNVNSAELEIFQKAKKYKLKKTACILKRTAFLTYKNGDSYVGELKIDSFLFDEYHFDKSGNLIQSGDNLFEYDANKNLAYRIKKNGFLLGSNFQNSPISIDTTYFKWGDNFLSEKISIVDSTINITKFRFDSLGSRLLQTTISTFERYGAQKLIAEKNYYPKYLSPRHVCMLDTTICSEFDIQTYELKEYPCVRRVEYFFNSKHSKLLDSVYYFPNINENHKLVEIYTYTKEGYSKTRTRKTYTKGVLKSHYTDTCAYFRNGKPKLIASMEYVDAGKPVYRYCPEQIFKKKGRKELIFPMDCEKDIPVIAPYEKVGKKKFRVNSISEYKCYRNGLPKSRKTTINIGMQNQQDIEVTFKHEFYE
jgi:hypothetical protein